MLRSTVQNKINPLRAHLNTAIYGDWYTGRWRVGCYICYSDEGPRPVPSSLYQASMASVPTLYYSMRHYTCLCTSKG